MRKNCLTFLCLFGATAVTAQSLNLTPGSPVIKSQHSSSAADIFFALKNQFFTPACSTVTCSKTYNYFDINSATPYPVYTLEDNLPQGSMAFKDLISPLSFNSLQYSGGSTAHWDHYLPGTYQNNGYNDVCSELLNDGCKPDVCSDQYSKGMTNFYPHDFFQDYVTFIKNLGADAAIIANAHNYTNANLLLEARDKISYVYTQTGKYPARVSIGAEESQLFSCWPTSHSYSDFVGGWYSNRYLTNYGITFTMDDDPPYSPNYPGGGWNTSILNNQWLAQYCHEGRLYLWADDVKGRLLGSPTNTTTDLDNIFGNSSGSMPMINKYINYHNGQIWNNWTDVFPASYNIAPSIWQWGINQGDPWYSSMLGCMYIARFYEWMAQFQWNTNARVPYASFYDLLNLIQIKYDPVDGFHLIKTNFYETLYLVGKLFTANSTYVYNITGNQMNSNIYAMATGSNNGTNDHLYVLLVNENSTPQTLQPSQINGAVSQSGATLTHYWIATTNLRATSAHFSQNSESIQNPGTSIVTLPKYSINVLEYYFPVLPKMASPSNSAPVIEANVYPNPANERIFVNVPSSNVSGFDVSIYDVNNQLIDQQHFTESDNMMDIQNLTSGIYIARISAPGYSPVYKKFIKQ